MVSSGFQCIFSKGVKMMVMDRSSAIMSIRVQKEILKGMLLGVRSDSPSEGLRFAAQSLCSVQGADALDSLAIQIERGRAWSESLAHIAGVPESIMAAVRSGEATGNLRAALENINANISAQEKVEGRFSQAMAYPRTVGSIFLLLFPFIVYLCRNGCVEFLSIMDGLSGMHDVQLKFMKLMSSIPEWGFIPLLAVCLMMLVALNSQSFITRYMLGFLNIIPGFNRILRSQRLSMLSFNLALLTSGGVPFDEALQACSAGLSPGRFATALDNAKRMASAGSEPWECLSSDTLYPMAIGWYLKRGGSEGLSDSFTDLAEYYAEDMEAISTGLAPILEAVMILVLGIVVGTAVGMIFTPLLRCINGV
jgi:type II secretory pathway component PulF